MVIDPPDMDINQGEINGDIPFPNNNNQDSMTAPPNDNDNNMMMQQTESGNSTLPNQKIISNKYQFQMIK